MAKLVWDEVSKRFFETGVSHGVLYPQTGANGTYANGVAWNGLTGVTQSPSGAEANPFYADNTEYVSLTSVEEFGATIEAYTYPDAFAVCDGSAELATGILLGQQSRKPFGLCYRTKIGNDVDGSDHGYKLHLVYGAMAAPSERPYQTINDSPEPISFSWEVTTTPVPVTGFKPCAHLEINSLKVSEADLAAIEDKLYGNTTDPATLLLPDEILALVTATVG